MLCSLLCAPLRADESEAAFFEALRERRLFELAEKYARDGIATRKQNPVEQADLTVELIRTLALHALHSAPDDRPERWQEARDAAGEFLTKSASHPRAMLVRVQDALTLLAQGELGRQENDVGVLTAAGKEQALAVLREASALLEQLDKELTREIPLRRRVEAKAGELSADELFSLHQHVRQQMARALRNRALLYPVGSEDRLSLLLSASGVLEDLLRELAADDPLAPPTQLDLGVCKRMLGDQETARRLLLSLDEEHRPAAVRSAAQAELIRLELAAGRRAAAVEKLQALPSTAISPDLDLVRLEIELDRLRAASGADAATERRQVEEAIETLARRITQTHGAYWGRRADQLVASALSSSGGAESTAILSRAADSLYLKGEFDQAIAAYEQAAAKAAEAADPKAAFDLRYKAALVQQRRSQFADAARRLRELSLSLRTHPQAGQAHLLAAWNAAQAARQSAEAIELYDAILEEHGSVWPTGEAGAQAQLWLGRLRETQKRWREAAMAYGKVPTDANEFPEALSGAAKAWKEALRAQQAKGSVDARDLQAALDYFESTADLSADKREPRSDSQRLAALTAAELMLDFGSADARRAETLLRAALARSPDAPAEWRAAASARLVVALASQDDQRGEARRLLAEAAKASPEQLLQMASSLADVADRAGAEDRPIVATLLLEALALLAPQRSALDRATQVNVDRLQVRALAAAGREKEAIPLAAQLARENPDHGEILESYANLLLESGDRALLEQGLGQWRTIAARARPRTERWYRAKYSVALAQFKLGDIASATTLLRYTLEAPPGLKGTAWEEPFQALLTRCRQVGEAQ